MKKTKRLGKLLIFLFLFTCLFAQISHAKTYSYKSLKLDYKLKQGLYDKGKNGYQLICIKAVTSQTITYQKTKVLFDDLTMADYITGYGKLYTKKLSKSIGLYLPSWEIYRDLMGSRRTYHSYADPEFKQLKFMKKVSRRKFFVNVGWIYAYMITKSNKVTKLIMPLILAG